MPITVAMIEEKEFKTKVRGYDPVEVDEFLDDICDEMIVMQEEISNLQARLRRPPARRCTPSPLPSRSATPTPKLPTAPSAAGPRAEDVR